MKDLAKELLNFNNLITPQVITFIYWLLMAGSVIAGLAVMNMGYRSMTFVQFLVGLGTIVIGIVVTRIWCELLIVLFKMNEALQDIRSSKPSGEQS
ncbi:membrane protein [Marinicella pacifica]|uniref:Membrane protein n=1 Tax=Marinicella pacifica TaxID=1171543 RepID=A0A917CXS4_9GAMM|nr:DUF4282 domain-containing protein [Marinicella pacifica]GGG02108.1 membrane protein [Marinicella pacifica]